MSEKISEIFEIRTGYTFRDAIPALEIGNTGVIQAGDINAARLADIPRIAFTLEKHMLQINDILLSARGATIARTVTEDLLPAVAASSVIILRPLNAKTNPRYIARYLNSEAGQLALSRITSGSYIKTLRKSELQELSIPIPPTVTQQTIVNLGEAIEKHSQLAGLKEQLFTSLYEQTIKLGETK